MFGSSPSCITPFLAISFPCRALAKKRSSTRGPPSVQERRRVALRTRNRRASGFPHARPIESLRPRLSPPHRRRANSRKCRRKYVRWVPRRQLRQEDATHANFPLRHRLSRCRRVNAHPSPYPSFARMRPSSFSSVIAFALPHFQSRAPHPRKLPT